MSDQNPEAQIITWARNNPNAALAAILTLFAIVAGILLPVIAFLFFVATLIAGGSLLAACYWYETAIRAQSEAFGLQIDKDDLANRLDKLIARHAEVVDQNTLLRDDLEHTPIPFEIVGNNVIPLPRIAGNQS